MMGWWFMTEKVNNPLKGGNATAMCEVVKYSPTSNHTFNKEADVE